MKLTAKRSLVLMGAILFFLPSLNINGATPIQPEPVVTENFQNNPLNRWKDLSGNWGVNNVVEIYNFQEKVLYQSPEEPGWIAYVGLWKERDGSLKITFDQIKGNPGLLPTYAPWYGRSSWDAWVTFSKKYGEWLGFSSEKEWEEIKTTGVSYPLLTSKDNGDTWEYLGDDIIVGGNQRVVQSMDGSYVIIGGSNPKDSRYRPAPGFTLIGLKNGILLRAPSAIEYSEKFGDTWMVGGAAGKLPLLGVSESLDNGKSWSPVQWLYPEGADKEIMAGASEENAMVETSDGRILVIVREEEYPNPSGGPKTGKKGPPVQTYLTRTGEGKYLASPPTWTPMPHSGLPELVRGSDGTIWYWGIDGIWYSTNEGTAWQRLNREVSSYYGKMVATGTNQILCATQVYTGDSPYPYRNDSYVKQVRFSYRRTGIVKQNDNTAPSSLLTLGKESFAGLHLKTDVKIDKAGGLAFNISPDGSSYYAFLVIMPGGSQYARWFPPENQPSSFSLSALGDEKIMMATGYPMAVLAKIDKGKIRVLRSMSLQKVRRGAWLQMQVKKDKDLIQGAINTGDGPAVYVGARDASYSSGGIGLMTEESSDEFKNLSVWSSPQMMRDNWNIGEYVQ